jgi:predicted Zn finger-like uncharacterized protein
MKIACPKCNAQGSIPDHEIPESGRFVSCPRCNEGFNVVKPRSSNNEYLVDTCPACSFSTFGDENFSSCPKCGVSVKAFVERQREELLQKRNQELLAKKLNNTEAAPVQPVAETAPVGDFIENLHPVNLIGWGVACVAIILLGIGLWGVFGYDMTKIQTALLEEHDEQVSGFTVFLRYGLLHWFKLLYGASALGVALLFIQKKKQGLNAMSILFRATMIIVPLLYAISFINWVRAPISHTLSGYLIEVLNVVFMSALIGTPLYFLEQYLHDRKITSVVKL